ncbi:MAG: DNA cytosine methyltransferase [Bacteroidetes bacterium]|nr:DNA cytosine methyltransferase [Bacteroidota bacterium]MBS1944109.1 DNA cytosine methyltransferase [Bacteroidota bacterium]
MVAVDLFAGCGGLSLGLERGGVHVCAGFELWKDACSVYAANFDHALHQVDLSEVDKAAALIKGYRPELIAGGPPCQDFSSAGHRKDKGTRADLTLDFCSIVCEVRPEWFLMENVTRIQSTAIFKEVKARFSRAGYGLTEVILDASLCGVPQKRKRVFLIGRLGEKEDFLMPLLQEKMSDREMTVRDYFGDALGTDFYYRHARSYARRGIYSVDEPSATVRGVNRPVPPGYRIHSNDATDDLARVRPLTPRERAQVQTFPASYKWPVASRTNLEQLIGNAVPVELARFVAVAIKEYADEHSSAFTARQEEIEVSG